MKHFQMNVNEWVVTSGTLELLVGVQFNTRRISDMNSGDVYVYSK